MNNKQVEIIIQSMSVDQLSEYLRESFCEPMRIIKENVHNGLKPMHIALKSENIDEIKKIFLKYEMTIDSNLKFEETMMPAIQSLSGLSLDQREKVKSVLADCAKGHQKELTVAQSLRQMLGDVSCEVYDLIRQLTYKTDDRIDIYNNYLVDLIEKND